MDAYDTVLKVNGHQAFMRDGFLVCKECPIASVGGRVYLDGEIQNVKADERGQIHVFRDGDALFNADTLRTFESQPLTLGHPPEGLITPDSWKKYAVGEVRNVHRGNGKYADSLMADLIIKDKDAIDAVMSGRSTELSCGFTSRTDEVGTGAAVESAIVGNHVALVPKGRCGSSVAIRQDAKPNGDSKMSIFNKDAKAPEMKEDGQPDVTALINSLSDKLEAFGNRISELEKARAEAQKPAEVKTDSKPEVKALTAEDVQKIVQEAFKQNAEQVKADASVIADAAVLAPSLSKETPDLAKAALAEYAKTALGRAFVEAQGGLSGIKTDAAPSVLHQAVIFERLKAAEPVEGKKPDATHKVPDFFKSAADLWK